MPAPARRDSSGVPAWNDKDEGCPDEDPQVERQACPSHVLHVQIKGPKTNIKTAASNSKGIVNQTIKMKKAGILIFTPIASKRCNTKRVGVTNVFTPPVTG